jgi:Putative transposase
LTVPKATWAKPWVVDCAASGEGNEAVLRYLARYVFRVAITNNRIVGLDDKFVTIRHKDRKSMQWRTTRLSGHEFMRRFLQHVLPRGLHKVRYYGLWHPARRERAERARLMLLLELPATPPLPTRSTVDRAADRPADHATSDETRICPCCQQGYLVRAARLYPKQASGP